jgi:hypothetical protein
LDSFIPSEGITLTKHTDSKEQLPPHEGRWTKMDPSEVAISFAFTNHKVKVHGNSDWTMPVGDLGVYFGIEPMVDK